MKLSKDIHIKVGFLVTGDGELGCFGTLEGAERAIQEEMHAYGVDRSQFHIYMYSETKREVISK